MSLPPEPKLNPNPSDAVASILQPRFCEVCGSKLLPLPGKVIGYHSFTGNPITRPRRVCPNRYRSHLIRHWFYES